jgi:hypothetical protein
MENRIMEFKKVTMPDALERMKAYVEEESEGLAINFTNMIQDLVVLVKFYDHREGTNSHNKLHQEFDKIWSSCSEVIEEPLN